MTLINRILVRSVKTLLILLSILILSVNLYSQEKNVYNYTEVLKNIKSEIIQLDSGIIFYQPYSLTKIKDYLIITDTSNEPSVSVLKIIDKDSLRLIMAMGREGKGPGEYISPWNVIPTKSNQYFYVYDAGIRRLTPYNADYNVISNSIINLKTSGVYIDLFDFDDYFIASGITPECRYEIIYKDRETAKCLGNLPDLNISDTVNPRSLAQRWHAYSTINAKKNKIALFYRHAARGTLMSLDGTLLNEIKDPKLGNPSFEIYNGNVIGGKNDLRAYISVTSNDQFIYALYSGRVSNSPSSSLGIYLHKFDWNLNLLDIYELDHASIHLEMADENHLYSIEYEPEPNIRLISVI